ncbi:tetratricopeptide repeat protein [Streptomyces spectabilis]|uniref:Tetratricopeptide repeat protein n=1 Tax=Streptomyces spectabilis TaxID=68270 RepID=A0A516R519_STRST|nr:tetratricopeptide repeat protein [Streptomyces spectabilis]
MTDQAVDTDGAARGAAASPTSAAAGADGGRFVGRHRELKELRADIDRAGLDTLSGRKAPRARVLLIAGRPGSGRTALAEELARQLADAYPDGILRARLSDPDGTPVPTERTARELLDALDVPAPAGAGEDDLTATLRAALADRRALLLLDDVADIVAPPAAPSVAKDADETDAADETEDADAVLAAGAAAQVDPLLPDTPDCLVVAVSGGPLTGIPDVRPCTLGGLDTKAALDLLTRSAGSVRITVDPRSAESLVEACGGHPAALVIAGGWLAARPKAAVADLTKQVRELPEDGAADSGLARVFRQAYAGLPGPAARILRLLCLAPAGYVDPHTASALAGCSVNAARATLDDFVALGLLRAVDSPLPQYDVPGCLVPLLRELTETQDRPGEVQLARARMLERTVRLLQSCRAVTEPGDSAARKKLAGLPRALRFPNPRAAAEWLRIRRPALLAAARLAVADGELDTLARRLMSALTRALAAHWGTEAAAPDLYGIHQLVLDVAERRDLPREQAAALLNLADLDARTGRTHEALARYRAALDCARAAGDPYATGRAMESVGGAYQELGDYPRAADWYGRALAEHQARDERAEAARLHGRIATAHTYAGRYGEALRNWSSAVAGHRKTGDLPARARALGELARVQEYAGRPEDCLRTCQEAVELARQAADTRLLAALQLRLADTLDRLGDPAAARLHRAAAERILGSELSGESAEVAGPASMDGAPASAYEIRSASGRD